MTDDYVLFMLDDMLLRQPVNEEMIEDALKVLENNPKVAVINFEKNYSKADFATTKMGFSNPPLFTHKRNKHRL